MDRTRASAVDEPLRDMVSWSSTRRFPMPALKASHSRERGRFRLCGYGVAGQRTLPIVFVVVSREQAIAAEDAEFLQRTNDAFLESLFVAQILRDAVGGREEHFSGRVESHQGACQNGCLSPYVQGADRLIILPPSLPWIPARRDRLASGLEGSSSSMFPIWTRNVQ